jgi:hypothetical protein
VITSGNAVVYVRRASCHLSRLLQLNDTISRLQRVLALRITLQLYANQLEWETVFILLHNLETRTAYFALYLKKYISLSS